MDVAETDDLAAWRARLDGTNINATSLLATDYLNHFNEVVMLIDMVADMPECLDDVREWQPKTYQQHFADSAFSDKDLAVEAYDHAPAAYRDRLEEMISEINRLVEVSIGRIASVLEGGDDGAIRIAATRASHDLQRLVEIAGAVINGSMPTVKRDELDAMFAD